MTPHFHRLEIADLRRETEDSVSIAFALTDSLREAYRFLPGQNLTVKTVIDGIELRRCYSICSAPDEGELRIAVKKQEGGLFSTFANERLAPGDALDVMTPAGNFVVPPATGQPRTYLGIAAGSGITPLLSIIKSVLTRESGNRFFLLYGNRTTRSIMFRETLEDLKDRFLDRLSITHALSREAQDIALLNGRIDEDKMRLLLKNIGLAGSVDHAFLCGPELLIETAERTLVASGVPRDRIHIERFTVEGTVAPPPRQPAAATRTEKRAVAEAEAVTDGINRRFPIGEGETVIEAALAAGLDLPYSCRGGMCCTCRAKLVEGKVTMDVNYSLEPWELAAGFVLTCQSRPQTERIVLDYDQI